MKIIIEHRKTKRRINGSFNICIGREDLQVLKEIIDSELNNEDGFSYGWIDILQKTEYSNDNSSVIIRQNSLKNTKPIEWD